MCGGSCKGRAHCSEDVPGCRAPPLSCMGGTDDGTRPLSAGAGATATEMVSSSVRITEEAEDPEDEGEKEEEEKNEGR